jgi:hemerythrin
MPKTQPQNVFEMNWSDRYAVGVEVIDRQHEVLFRLIDTLAKGIQSGNPESTLQAVFDELTEYVRVHFETEHRLMVEYDFPEEPAHEAKHRELQQSLNDLIERTNAGQPWVSLETMNFLRQWLYHHIDDTDRRLAEHLASRGVK